MRYVRNAWYVAGWEQDLAVATPYPITILGDRIVLYRTEGGRLVALEDRCVHRLAPLSLGRCEGERLRCMYHGLLFDPDGTVVEIPGQELIPAQARVRSYAVVARHDWLWVWMGDAAQADPSLIPPAVGSDNGDYILGRGFLDYRAEARLINDNLLDFSHLSFVHANSFGAPRAFADARPKLETLARGVRFSRWTVGTFGSAGRKSDEPIDSYMTYDFLIPGILLMWSGNFARGSAEAAGFGVPDFAQAIAGVTFTSQAVTPMAGQTARYFFSWGPHRDHGNEDTRAFLMTLADMAFGEDKVIIEAQQEVINATPDPVIMPTAHDRGVTIFNRLVERIAREEEDRAAEPARDAERALA